jgi:DNA-3-methyladenine glycosylase I
VDDDVRLFEKMSLESFQSGLSWRTILNKREGFRSAFRGFEPVAVAAFGEDDVARLLQDAGIVRHRGKIEATIANARTLLEIQERHGSLAAFVWGFEPPAEERPEELTWEVLRTMAKTPAAARLAKSLKKEGWRFFGPTTCYAFMQAMGLVNDHVVGCPTRAQVEAARRKFRRP